MPRTLYTNAVQFPATQITSSDVNCLDDYEEGTWTPSLTFSTPGDVTPTYAANGRLGWYTKIGNTVNLWFNINCTNFTHSTASGTLNISGLPFTPNSTAGYIGAGTTTVTGITKAGYTQVTPYVAPATPLIYFSIWGSGNVQADVSVADVPTATGKTFRGFVSFIV